VLRDVVRAHVVDHFGAPDAVLVLDEEDADVGMRPRLTMGRIAGSS